MSEERAMDLDIARQALGLGPCAESDIVDDVGPRAVAASVESTEVAVAY